MNRPHILRGPGSASEAAVIKLKIRELRSGGDNRDDMTPERGKPSKESSRMLGYLFQARYFVSDLFLPP